MINQQDTLNNMRNKYLSMQEVEILKEIQQEQDKYFKPYINMENFLRWYMGQ